jgi:hypothetical protein
VLRLRRVRRILPLDAVQRAYRDGEGRYGLVTYHNGIEWSLAEWPVSLAATAHWTDDSVLAGDDDGGSVTTLMALTPTGQGDANRPGAAGTAQRPRRVRLRRRHTRHPPTKHCCGSRWTTNPEASGAPASSTNPARTAPPSANSGRRSPPRPARCGCPGPNSGSGPAPTARPPAVRRDIPVAGSTAAFGLVAVDGAEDVASVGGCGTTAGSGAGVRAVVPAHHRSTAQPARTA